MNKKVLGLSALGLLALALPAFSEDKPADAKEQYKQGKDVGTSSSYQTQSAAQPSGATPSTTDQTASDSAKDDMTTQAAGTSKQPASAGGASDSKIHPKGRTEADSSGNAAKEKKSKN